MALFNASQIDLIKQGLFKTPVKVSIEDRDYGFFRNNLFGLPSQGTRDDYLMLDYKNIGVVLPDEALKGADPERVNYGTGFNEKAIFGKYFNNEDEISADQCDNRIFGEDINAPLSHEERMVALLAEKRDRIIQSHNLGFEKACVDAVLNGSFTTRGGGSQSFPVTSGLLSVSGAGMSTSPLTVLGAGVKAIIKKKGGKPTMLILNPDDAATLAESTAWQALFDNRRMYGSEYNPAAETDGLSPLGTINLPGVGSIRVYAYYGAYDNGGTWTYFIPQGKAILCPDKLGYKGFCGVYVDNGVYTGKEGMEHGVYIWFVEGPQPHKAHVQVQSAPCPMLTAIDRYCVFTSIS